MYHGAVQGVPGEERMNVLLTDVLSCPRCGPEFGLVLLAERVEERRVLEGELGCPNCRERYAVRGGFGDLRGPHEHGAVSGPASGGGEAAYRLAALMGVHEGPGFSLVVGPSAGLAPGVAEVVPELEVVALDASAEGLGEAAGVSRLAFEGRLPFHGGSMLAVALTGEAATSHLEEGARVLWGGGRLVLDPAPADAEARLAAVGMRVLASEGGVVVAGSP